MKFFGWTITKGDPPQNAAPSTQPQASGSDAPDHVKTAALTVLEYFATHPEIIKVAASIVAASTPNSDAGRVAGTIAGAMK